MEHYFSSSAEETIELGQRLGASLKAGQIICFKGELAAGKTTFIKGLVAGISNFSQDNVNSPTFAYLNIYEGEKTVYHFDLYRLGDADEFLAMGFEDYLFGDGICCIEWAERIEEILPDRYHEIFIQHQGDDARMITIKTIDGSSKNQNEKS